MTEQSASVRLVLLRPRTEVALDELVRIDGAAEYSILHFADGHQLRVAISICHVHVRLPELLQIHKRHLINLAYVSAVYRHKPALQLSTGETLPVARRRKNHVRVMYLKYRQNP